MKMNRPAFKIDTENPGSEIAGEAAAALAAASILFRAEDPTYSQNLLGHAQALFDFAASTAATISMSSRVPGTIIIRLGITTS